MTEVSDLYDDGWLQCNACKEWTQMFDQAGDPCPACGAGILGKWMKRTETF